MARNFTDTAVYIQQISHLHGKGQNAGEDKKPIRRGWIVVRLQILNKKAVEFGENGRYHPTRCRLNAHVRRTICLTLNGPNGNRVAHEGGEGV